MHRWMPSKTSSAIGAKRKAQSNWCAADWWSYDWCWHVSSAVEMDRAGGWRRRSVACDGWATAKKISNGTSWLSVKRGWFCVILRTTARNIASGPGYWKFFAMWSIFHRSIIRLRYLSCVASDRIMLPCDTEYAGVGGTSRAYSILANIRWDREFASLFSQRILQQGLSGSFALSFYQFLHKLLGQMRS